MTDTPETIADIAHALDEYIANAKGHGDTDDALYPLQDLSAALWKLDDDPTADDATPRNPHGLPEELPDDETVCPRCSEPYAEHVDLVQDGVEPCSACYHNARRSGAPESPFTVEGAAVVDIDTGQILPASAADIVKNFTDAVDTDAIDTLTLDQLDAVSDILKKVK